MRCDSGELNYGPAVSVGYHLSVPEILTSVIPEILARLTARGASLDS